MCASQGGGALAVVVLRRLSPILLSNAKGRGRKLDGKAAATKKPGQ